MACPHTTQALTGSVYKDMLVQMIVSNLCGQDLCINRKSPTSIDDIFDCCLWRLPYRLMCLDDVMLSRADVASEM